MVDSWSKVSIFRMYSNIKWGERTNLPFTCTWSTIRGHREVIEGFFFFFFFFSERTLRLSRVIRVNAVQ